MFTATRYRILIALGQLCRVRFDEEKSFVYIVGTFRSSINLCGVKAALNSSYSCMARSLGIVVAQGARMRSPSMI